MQGSEPTTVSVSLPCDSCEPSHFAVVDDVRAVIRCEGCGRERPLRRRVLYLVSGAPATGKTALVGRLAGRIEGLAVLDSDLMGAVAHPDWASWATAWLLVAHGLAGSGMSTVLCGYGMHRWEIERLAARRLVGDVKTLNLDVDDDVLRDRLRRRPNYDDDRIERKVRMAASLREAADVNVDTTPLGLDQVSEVVERWLLASQSGSEGS